MNDNTELTESYQETNSKEQQKQTLGKRKNIISRVANLYYIAFIVFNQKLRNIPKQINKQTNKQKHGSYIGAKKTVNWNCPWGCPGIGITRQMF